MTVQVRKTGPRTYNAGATIRRGQVVVGTDNSNVVPSTGASTRVLGIAVTDAVASNAAGSTAPNGQPIVNMAPLPTIVSVADCGIEVDGVTFLAAAKFGDPLVGAANGQVTPAAAGADGATVVGRCTQPGGVAAGQTGRVRTA